MAAREAWGKPHAHSGTQVLVILLTAALLGLSVQIALGATVPAVSGISPGSGPVAGGTVVTVTGTGFTGATRVRFGTIAGAAVTVVSDTQLTVNAPAAATTGAMNLRVTTPGGTSPVDPADRYTYLSTPLYERGITMPHRIRFSVASALSRYYRRAKAIRGIDRPIRIAPTATIREDLMAIAARTELTG